MKLLKLSRTRLIYFEFVIEYKTRIRIILHAYDSYITNYYAIFRSYFLIKKYNTRFFFCFFNIHFSTNDVHKLSDCIYENYFPHRFIRVNGLKIFFL